MFFNNKDLYKILQRTFFENSLFKNNIRELLGNFRTPLNSPLFVKEFILKIIC